jgi:CRP-like cAMP-binding protein
MIGPMERALFLHSLGGVADLPPAQVAVFAEHARERRFRAGEPLLRADEPATAFHVIVDGAVRAAGGEYLDGAELGPRGSVGFLSMLGRRTEGVAAEAVEDTVTLEFEDDVLHDILEDDFDLVDGLIRNLARRTLRFRRLVPPDTYLAPLEGRFRSVERSFDLVERILLLRRPGSPFGRSSLDAVTQLARNTPEIHFEKGTTIWKSGDRSDYAVVLISGSVVCTTQWGLSRFRTGPGYPLGNLERFSRDPRWYTAVAETPVVGLRTDTDRLLDVLEDHFDMALSLLEAMARRLIRIQEETAEVRERDAAAA